MPLPIDFAWFPDFQVPSKLSLRIGGVHGREVALVNERVDGAGWLTTTNRHLDWGHVGHSVLRSRDLAIRMATRWAVFHAKRLRAECVEKDAAMHRMAGSQWADLAT